MKFCTDVQHLWSKLNFTAHYREVGVKGQGQNHGVENLSITVAWPRFEISLPNLAVWQISGYTGSQFGMKYDFAKIETVAWWRFALGTCELAICVRI